MSRFLIFIVFIIFHSCTKKKESFKKSDLKHSVSIQLQETKDSTHIYPIYSDNVYFSKNELPITSFVIGSSSYYSYFAELNAQSSIKGVLSAQNFYTDYIKNNQIPEVGNNQFLDVEKIIQINPKLLILYPNPNHINQIKILKKHGIQTLFLEDYKEKTPLGKSELIKLFGILTTKKEKANQSFNQIERNYTSWKNKASQQQNKPTVFGKIMYGDFWFMPQGESFSVQYYQDAGGNYLWKEKSGTESMQLSFEEVLGKAKNADFWLDASDLKYKNQLLQQNAHYQLFDAFKNNHVYSISKQKKENGTNNYYESGSLYVDSVLMDYISILHPKLLPNYSTKYIQKLE
ncbi:MAG: ABC transporter substrate-binding protein [Flavobacteriales bacterium]|nr:ABC transporter substrate-binding protein [Flavobacteriales bacterium]